MGKALRVWVCAVSCWYLVNAPKASAVVSAALRALGV